MSNKIGLTYDLTGPTSNEDLDGAVNHIDMIKQNVTSTTTASVDFQHLTLKEEQMLIQHLTSKVLNLFKLHEQVSLQNMDSAVLAELSAGSEMGSLNALTKTLLNSAEITLLSYKASTTMLGLNPKSPVLSSIELMP
ncbi:hypothetical protein FQN50_009008 [Emmonsiellopsis sp. PD_5]|nr:hypothetical protein FQN50_009008 [Emmonsiellopsis sp. PD_5]